jgi:hypothetical protein
LLFLVQILGFEELWLPSDPRQGPSVSMSVSHQSAFSGLPRACAGLLISNSRYGSTASTYVINLVETWMGEWHQRSKNESQHATERTRRQAPDKRQAKDGVQPISPRASDSEMRGKKEKTRHHHSFERRGSNPVLPGNRWRIY